MLLIGCQLGLDRKCRFRLHSVSGQDVQHVTDGLFSIGGLRKRQVVLDLIAIAATVFLLHDVAGFGEIIDDAIGMTLGDAEVGGNVA